jgi:hypothetical protein
VEALIRESRDIASYAISPVSKLAETESANSIFSSKGETAVAGNGGVF